jgi:hypothetical protein
MCGEIMSQALVDTLIEKNPHLGAFGEKFSGLFQSSDSHFAGNCREPFQKILKGFAALEVIEQILDRDTSSAENRRAPEYFGISYNNVVVRTHERIYLKEKYIIRP